MLKLKTYRARLILYIVVLVVFLVGSLGYSYVATRSALIEETEDSLRHTVQLLSGQMAAVRDELQRYALIVRDDLRLQEYMFIIVQLSGDGEPLQKLYERQFGWLPTHRTVILGEHGQAIVGAEHEDLIAEIGHKATHSVEYTLTFFGQSGLELVAVAPIRYRGNELGVVAISYLFDAQRLSRLGRQGGGELLIVDRDSIAASTMDELVGRPFVQTSDKMVIDGTPYRLNPIDLPQIEQHAPRLWFAVSAQRLTDNLTRYERITVLTLSVGGILILLVGIIIMRDFSRPLGALMSMTARIAEGELPDMGKKVARNEIDSLANQFADMLHSLRSKQREVDDVHRQLEELVITDTLTGLNNRRYLQDIFPKLKAQADRDRTTLSIILCDLDHFKKINDVHGHLCGDQCLIHFAWILKKYSRTNDFLFRMGGEEFLLLCMNEDIPGAVALAEKIRSATQNDPIKFEGNTITMTVSCGISSTATVAETDLSSLLSSADAGLYQAKDAGRNQVCVGPFGKRRARQM